MCITNSNFILIMRKKVSLVLSSGGARGIAHIGAIEELLRQGFEISSISGTSIGALVGGMYASGFFEAFKKRLKELNKISIVGLVDISFEGEGFIKGDRIIKEFKNIFGDMAIEDCQIPFTAVATDIRQSKEVVFEKGSLYEAIRASISIPSVFKPYKLNGMVLVDGGVKNPLPLNRIKRTPDDLLVAVDVSAPNGSYKPKKKKSGISAHFKNSTGHLSFINEHYSQMDILSQSMKMMLQEIAALSVRLNKPDISVNIPMSKHEVYEFYNYDKIYKDGMMAMRKALEDYQNNL